MKAKNKKTMFRIKLNIVLSLKLSGNLTYFFRQLTFLTVAVIFMYDTFLNCFINYLRCFLICNLCVFDIVFFNKMFNSFNKCTHICLYCFVTDATVFVRTYTLNGRF